MPWRYTYCSHYQVVVSSTYVLCFGQRKILEEPEISETTFSAALTRIWMSSMQIRKSPFLRSILREWWKSFPFFFFCFFCFNMGTEILRALFVSLPNTLKKFSSKARRSKKHHPELNIFSLCNSSPGFYVVLLHAKLPFMAEGIVWLGHVLANGYTSELSCSCRNLFGLFVLAVFSSLILPLAKIWKLGLGMRLTLSLTTSTITLLLWKWTPTWP